MADAAQHGKVTGVDDTPPLDPVAEAGVGQAQRDRVAAAQRVEVAERGAVGRAVPGDGRRPALARAAACRR